MLGGDCSEDWTSCIACGWGLLFGKALKSIWIAVANWTWRDVSARVRAWCHCDIAAEWGMISSNWASPNGLADPLGLELLELWKAPRIVSWWTITTTLSANGCSAWMDKAQVQPRARSYIGCRLEGSQLCNSRLIKGRSYDDTNRRANAQEQIQWQTRKADTRAVWEIVDGEECSERLILGSVKQLISFKNHNVGLGW